MVHNRDHPFLHIIVIHIIIRIIIFLFCTASANLIAYFPLKPMGICFLHYWPALPCFKSFILLPVCELQPQNSSFQLTLTIVRPYKYTPNSPLMSIYCIINLVLRCQTAFFLLYWDGKKGPGEQPIPFLFYRSAVFVGH